MVVFWKLKRVKHICSKTLKSRSWFKYCNLLSYSNNEMPFINSKRFVEYNDIFRIEFSVVVSFTTIFSQLLQYAQSFYTFLWYWTIHIPFCQNPSICLHSRLTVTPWPSRFPLILYSEGTKCRWYFNYRNFTHNTLH